ncbi:DUF6879 family protein [Streptomyces sp. NPDC048644]|uniref:DUF6879 family protein n=1 Tax=Streptomyces sp. NPDC048644 TaxID=3365582 RepID=UPI00371EF799
MELISSAERNQLIERFAHDAFHLELRDDYTVPHEESPFTSWQRGEPNDLSWFGTWGQLVRRVVAAGCAVRRVRVVSEPHSPYIQWEHAVTAENLKAGEDIRWLPRHQVPSDIGFPLGGNDWWLLGDHLLAVGHFGEDGRVLGSEVVEEPATVAECVRVRNLLWDIAIPHTEYKFLIPR